jgi:hypothetical protein
VKPGNRTPIPTVSQVVERATALVAPNGEDAAVDALFEGFEDDDRPVTASEDIASELGRTVDAIDPEDLNPAARVAVAAAVWLATNFEQNNAREHVIREGVRLHFRGRPPEPVAGWLDAEGIAV